MEFNLKNPKRLSQWIVAAISSDITKLANANGENVVRDAPQRNPLQTIGKRSRMKSAASWHQACNISKRHSKFPAEQFNGAAVSQIQSGFQG
ncbi:MAG: hypothetical protein WCC92_01540 [Candidatus Korobacteraceae bacterium]